MRGRNFYGRGCGQPASSKRSNPVWAFLSSLTTRKRLTAAGQVCQELPHSPMRCSLGVHSPLDSHVMSDGKSSEVTDELIDQEKRNGCAVERREPEVHPATH